MTVLLQQAERPEAAAARRLHEYSTPTRTIVTCAVGGDSSSGHEASTRAEIARRLAHLMGFAYGGEHDPNARYAGRPYFVPNDTLTSAFAASLGIRGADDLFGGVVPAEFVATKTITHSLVAPDAVAPAGWSMEFPQLVANSVLAGYSAFGKADALRAGRQLLERGPVRVKLASGVAGMGQWVADDEAALTEVLEAIADQEIAASGLVIEENLADVITHSVGYVRVAEMIATYCGAQHATTNNHGVEVYGGSELRVVRGGFGALLALDLPVDARLAIAQARVYDDAADRCFPGFYASRRNYDIAQGVDARGQRRCGVLEQSWRLGGASGAEIGALEAFRAEATLQTVRAVSREIYGDTTTPPANASVYFRGIDPRVGALMKFTVVEAYADTR
jgi:Protein of unknown function (DUF3182)